MDTAKRSLVLGLVAFFCGLIVVAIAAAGMPEVRSKARLIGVVAGSFGSGAALVSAIRDYSTRRGKSPGA